MTAEAKVIADSITEAGDRLTTVQATMHRFVLAEFNTHRVFSRNSASSRAIPVEKMLARFTDNPSWPLEWPSEKPGMQGGEPLEDHALLDAKLLLEQAHADTAALVAGYLDTHTEKSERLHKSIVNRLMEWGQWHTAVVSSTAWENFFAQRCSPLAQPEIRVVAEAIRDAIKNSTPKKLFEGEWHLPYVSDEEHDWAEAEHPGRAYEALVPVSVARCARVSYLTQEGKRDPAEDIKLYERLVSARPMHASPLEHVARPAPWNVHNALVDEEDLEGNPVMIDLTLPKVGNFIGWIQHRHIVEAALDWQSFD